MKSTKDCAKKETPRERADSDQLDDLFPLYEDSRRVHDPFENEIPNYKLDPASVSDFPPLASPEQLKAMQDFYEHETKVDQSKSIWMDGQGVYNGFDPEAAWIQTHSGRRFCPTNPNPNSIVIQDIAHSLSMQCRFTGHCSHFYSVAQHSVLVSYICDSRDALWGLLHDASEAYLVDVPRPLKRSGKFQAYIDFEKKMQEAVCKRFGLPYQEPASVKKADSILLATEARELMSPLHEDWVQVVDPLPFRIDPLPPQAAKDMFMKRFFELTGSQIGYEHYLKYKDRL
jgi:5'-deoxynucleotidase YfbR-like HD superfamily hydrolase